MFGNARLIVERRKLTMPRRKPRNRKRKNPAFGKGLLDIGIPPDAAVGLIVAGLCKLFPGVRKFVQDELNKPMRAMEFGPDYPTAAAECDHSPEDKPCPRDATGAFINEACKHYGHVPGMCHSCVCLRQQD